MLQLDTRFKKTRIKSKHKQKKKFYNCLRNWVFHSLGKLLLLTLIFYLSKGRILLRFRKNIVKNSYENLFSRSIDLSRPYQKVAFKTISLMFSMMRSDNFNMMNRSVMLRSADIPLWGQWRHRIQSKCSIDISKLNTEKQRTWIILNIQGSVIRINTLYPLHQISMPVRSKIWNYSVHNIFARGTLWVCYESVT